MRIRGIRRAIVVHTRRTATGRDTTVSIDHLIPEPSADVPTAVWRISSRPARLRASELVNAAAVNQCFAERRGRAIACVDIESSTTMAAIAYHIDPDEDRPVLLTDVAVRRDPTRVDISHGCVLILKAYLHELGSILGRPDQVGYFAATRGVADDYARLYEFRRGPAADAWRRSGRWYLEQPPSDD
jgi:hypothetical protein